MEVVLRTRLKLLYDSVQTCLTSAQCALKQASENNTDLKDLELICSKLKGANERFVAEIHSYCQATKEPDVEQITQYTSIQIQAEDLITEIDLFIKRSDYNRSSNTIADRNPNVTSKLPRMELSKFDGDVLKWYQFWDQFSSNVDSRKINDVDKLLYLQSVLEGDAKQAIEGLDTTNKNYSLAVQTLKERFGKPTAIIDAHYVALYRIKPVATKEVKDCRQVLNEIERHLRVLKSLGEDVNHNHLRVMIMEKFPEDLIYEVKMKITGDEEKIDDIRKYLEYIIAARETSNRLKKNTIDAKILDSTKDVTESITTGSLHINSENRVNTEQRRMRNFRKDKNKNEVGNSIKTQSDFKKRPYDKQFSSDEPPKKKFCSKKCVFCSQDHYNDECSKFRNLNDRKLKLNNRCYNCFQIGHRASTCRSKRKCRHCNEYGTHNRALCPKKFADSVISDTNTLHVTTEINTTLLQTCLVMVGSSNKGSRQQKCRILLDCGSQRSYITDSVVKNMKLPVNDKINLTIFTFGSKSPHQIESPIVNFKILTRTGVTRDICANAVPHITHAIRTPVFKDSMNLEKLGLQNLILADDGSGGDQIDILLGNDYYHTFMLPEKITVTQNLFLVNSDFGWIWSGKVCETYDKRDQLSVLTYFQSDGALGNNVTEPDLPLKIDDVKQLWDLESIGIRDSPKSTRDEEAIKHFNETIEFKENRYHVQWPWTESVHYLPNNLGLARGRLNSLVKRLSYSELNAYNDVIQEQLQSGVIEMIPNPYIRQAHAVHYLPHHCVYSQDKSKKLRIVYDASAKSGDNQSLNECLYRGPLLLEDLTGLLLKFREHPIGIVADVEKAFLQLGLQENDRDVTRFLWLKDINNDTNSENIVHFRFCRVPFGVISSPFLLNATIRYHLTRSNNGLMQQLANDIYVDNIVTGTKTVLDGISLYETSKTAFESLSMNLREWNSNSKELISFIPERYKAKDQQLVKVLGLIWDTYEDNLSLKTNFSGNDINSVFTKRDVLKIVASVYDPCGFAVPLLLPAKLFFQKLWKNKMKWDVKLDPNLISEWHQIALQLNYLNNIKVERFYAQNLNYNDTSDNIEYELHCFTDSSKEAYAAVIYLRSSLHANNIVSFVIGKSRLVPLKDQVNLQIPRLELLGVLIGCRLLSYVMKFLRLKIRAQFLWTDSQVVLSWCKSDKLLPPFVARRVTEIKENKSLQMRYVPTNLNPSDVGTRADRVESYDSWLKGPEFLSENSEKWPIIPSQNEVQTISLVEEGLTNKDSINSVESAVANKDSVTNKDSINSVESDVADIDSVIENVQYSNRDQIETIKEIQSQYFPKEIAGEITDLARSLHLYKDHEGVIRCKGRFKHADLSHDQKEPILLPKNSEFTIRLISDLHQKNYHVGVSHTLALLRKNFWVPHGRATVQKVIRKCPFKLPAMPDLPTERVKLSLPFAFSGIDYFGPLLVNEGTSEKRWVCLFTCLTIRAIHMEVVKDLSAEECLLAIRRFIAVRGFPQLIISDNASQFKLTAEVLISNYCVQNNLRWKFIPELAPWFGGFYERLIGIVKHSMKRTLEKHLINHNQLCTVLKEIEAVINTRPLTTVGAELEHVLSPQNFLRVGGSVTTQISGREFLEPATVTKCNLIDGWKRGQIILAEFSKMFANQYLTSLRERNDKHRQSRVVVNKIPKLEETVQIKADSNRVHWKVGKIAELVRGSDGQIRVARVKTSTGEILTRSIGHLFPLEIEDESTVPESEQNQISPVQRIEDSIHTESGQTDRNKTSHQIENIESLSKTKVSSKIEIADNGKRSARASAIRGREKVKEWTAQLLMRLFMQ